MVLLPRSKFLLEFQDMARSQRILIKIVLLSLVQYLIIQSTSKFII